MTGHGCPSYLQFLRGGNIKMPTTKFRGFIFRAMMSVIMAYDIKLYNVSRKWAGWVTLSFFQHWLRHPICVCLYFWFQVYSEIRSVKNSHLNILHPEKIILFLLQFMISSCTVSFMCPTMSLVATIIFSGISNQFVANWSQRLRRISQWLFGCCFSQGLSSGFCFEQFLENSWLTIAIGNLIKSWCKEQ